jgi:hypothetical protein
MQNMTQAGVICFLLSPAARDINGTTLPVDQVHGRLCGAAVDHSTELLLHFLLLRGACLLCHRAMQQAQQQFRICSQSGGPAAAVADQMLSRH